MLGRVFAYIIIDSPFLLVLSRRIAPPSPRAWISLHLTSCEGSLEAVEVLLEHGANVHMRDIMGGTALHDASWGGHLRIMRLLLKNGADVDAQSNKALTALHLASYHGDVDIVAQLLEHGADIHGKDSKGQKYGTLALATSPLHL
jgi:ankyrin repeat protein